MLQSENRVLAKQFHVLFACIRVRAVARPENERLIVGLQFSDDVLDRNIVIDVIAEHGFNLLAIYMIEDRFIHVRKIKSFTVTLLETIESCLARGRIKHQVVRFAHISATLLNEPSISNVFINSDVALVVGNLNAIMSD